LINNAAYTGVRFSPDVTKDGGNLQLQRMVRQGVKREKSFFASMLTISPTGESWPSHYPGS